jgi:hypothetical protein
MRIPVLPIVVLLVAAVGSSNLTAGDLEVQDRDYKVPCVRQSETWICAGKLSEQPACIDVDANRMVCTGTPVESPYRETARAESRLILNHPL